MDKWSLCFSVKKGSSKFPLLELVDKKSEKRQVIVNLYDGIWLEVLCFFDARQDPIALKATLQGLDEITVICTGNRIALYQNGRLEDENWPLGQVDLSDVSIVTQKGLERVSIGDAQEAVALEETMQPEELEQIHDIVAYQPRWGNATMGDCMPFYHDGVYHLFYLFDRRRHNSKWGLGAHQWAHLTTTDFRTWQEQPMAISIDHQYEGSICTGSVMYHDGNFYAFYAVRMSDGSPAQMTYSISKDCIHFTKTYKTICLGEPFDGASARDPKVFCTPDGSFHMLVTTSIREENGWRGCLAHLVSKDLEDWEVLPEPMVLSPDGAQPECSDYFKIGEYYYLIYSLNAHANYCVSKNPLGPDWKPLGLVGGFDFTVPKFAAFGPDGKRLIAAGFLRHTPGYGGTLAFIEAKAEADGRLTFETPAELVTS